MRLADHSETNDGFDLIARRLCTEVLSLSLSDCKLLATQFAIAGEFKQTRNLNLNSSEQH